MGNRISCSCAPLIKKAGYRYEESPWSLNRRRDGILLRLWAEVFHVSSSGAGTVKWQQVSEDLVPVNISSIQDSPDGVYHITAYNSQVDKILDVRLVQPGTRIGQASECFVYWKDPATNDTWGLNFTSPIDAKSFKDCCSGAAKFRKASSSYSLKMDANRNQGKNAGKNVRRGGKPMPMSTPASPSRREPQCTCMTKEQYARLRAQDPRIRGSSTLPRTQGRSGEVEGRTTTQSGQLNVAQQQQQQQQQQHQQQQQQQHAKAQQQALYDTMGSRRGMDAYGALRSNRGTHSSQISLQQKAAGMQMKEDLPNGRASSAADNRSLRGSRRELASKSVDYSEMDTVREGDTLRRRNRSRSTDDVSNKGNSEAENNPQNDTPTNQLLQEYEMHLRNTLAKGMDAESYSLHTFEALLSQSMENLGHPIKHSTSMNSTRASERSLPTAGSRDDRDHSGYFSDRNASFDNRRDPYERGYTSDHDRTRFYDRQDSVRSGCTSDRERGYTSDRESYGYLADRERSMSDREKGYMSDRERYSERDRGYMSDRDRGYMSDRERGYTSDRERGYMSDRERTSYSLSRDRGYMSDRDSRGYYSDRERRYSSDREHTALSAQASMESADSRLCYLTSSEISDDDRMSLTTAVSDEEEDRASTHNSPFRPPRIGSSAASFNCTGAVRKAGFLSVKKWLLRKKHQIELARKRGWKGYWVCLKGTTLLFYPCDSREGFSGKSVEAAPKHLIIVDGAIMQPVPEHPKRDHIFCLSTAFGDAYLFQAPCQIELENWVNSIHSACAAAFARHRGKTGTLHLLQEEIFRIDRAIESDSKLKHMAELQLSVVSDVENKQQIIGQIQQWEENLERLHCEQFRLRCYMSSLQSGELPNPKGLLAHVSRTTKTTLNRLGVFTVSSFHAYICARSPSLLNNLLAGRGATKRSNSVSSRRSLQLNSLNEPEKQFRVTLPDNQIVSICVKESMTVEEFLVAAASKRSLNPMEHFVRVKKRRELEETNYFVPHRTDLIENYLATHEVVEICGKILYQVELSRSSLDHMWGFSVEAELVENSERQDELCCYISRVEDRSTAMQNGIIKSDEIMVINGAIVSDLDMMYIESVLQEELALCLMMRSSRTDPPDLASLMKTTDEIIESLVCPPPPREVSLNEETISQMIVPAPNWNRNQIPFKERVIPQRKELPSMDSYMQHASDTSERSNVSSMEIETFLKNSELSGGCRSPDERRLSPTGSVVSTQSQSQLTPSKQMTDAERLRKVIIELVETERTYVKHLNGLLQNYLEPLRSAAFLSSAEVTALFGNIQEIVAFQRLFLEALQQAVEIDPGFYSFEHPHEFKNILFSIGSAFLYYASQFKLYSSFCASHSKAQKVLHPNDGNQALQEFLNSRNPRQQHSSTLESYLIKPIQRILKYPLLLQQLKSITNPGSDEHRHLLDALKVMEKVAEHINEMQRIHEEYGAIFDHLFRQHHKSVKHPIDLSPGDLLYYGGIEWLNISDFLGKIKKGLELHAMCFVFKTAVVFLCKERLRQKKKLMGGSNKSNSSEVEIIRYQVLIPVTEVQVRASSMKDVDNHFLWELIHLKSQTQRRSEKVYHLSNSTSEFRNAFLRTIRQIIRESVRNMNIPLGKPGISSAPVLKQNTGSSNRMNTHTLQSRPTAKKRGVMNPTTSLQRPISGKQNYDPVESYDNVPETQRQHPDPPQRSATETYNKSYDPSPKYQRSASDAPQQQRFSSDNYQKKSSLQHQAQQGNTSGSSYDSDQSGNFRTRSRTVPDAMDELSDSTTKSDIGLEDGRSETEEDPLELGANGLGHTPNHLSLSTTSTLSTGSTGSQARLIHASNQPANYQPTKSLGSPVWKPREDYGSTQSIQSAHGSTTSLSSRYSTRSQQNPPGYFPSTTSISTRSSYETSPTRVGSYRRSPIRYTPGQYLTKNVVQEEEAFNFYREPSPYSGGLLQISRSLSKTTIYSSMCDISENGAERKEFFRSSSSHSVKESIFNLKIPPRRYYRPS